MFKGNENGEKKSFSLNIADGSLNDTKNANSDDFETREVLSDSFFCVRSFFFCLCRWIVKKLSIFYFEFVALVFIGNNLLSLSARKINR